MDEIKNKVSESGIVTIDLENFYVEGERVIFDIQQVLFQGLILKEKEFREFIKSTDWSFYQNKIVGICCSVDAIVPTWAYMLLSIAIEPFAAKLFFGTLNDIENFLFIEYPIEIFGHAGLSYSTTFTDLHKIIYENPEHNFTLIGLDELGKAKPATLFFLSKNGYLGNNIKFIRTKDIEDSWSKCDAWITDNKKIIDLVPENKIVITNETTDNENTIEWMRKKRLEKFM